MGDEVKAVVIPAAPIVGAEAALVAQGYTSDEAVAMLTALNAGAVAVKAAVVSGDSLDEAKARRIVEEIVARATKALEAKVGNLGVRYDDGADIEKQVKQLRGDAWMLGHVLQRSPKTMDEEVISRAFSRHHGLDYSAEAVRRALDTTDMSSIVPTDLVRSMLADMEKSSVVLDNCKIVDMPQNPWESPYQTSSMTLYGVDEATDDEASAVKASDVGVNKITFAAKKVGARALWSRELDEASAIAILPLLREDYVRLGRDGWERNFIFGDETTANTNINFEGTAPTTTAGQKDHWLQADGMVHHCIIDHTGQAKDVGAAFDKNTMLVIRKKLGKYGDRPGDLFSIFSRDLLYDAMALAEFLTIDKLGVKATILTGQLGAIHGVALGVSDGLPLTDATGKIDDTAGDNVKKSFLVYNRVLGVIIGRRGELRISVDTINKTDQYEGVMYSSYDIQFPRDLGLAYGYNIT